MMKKNGVFLAILLSIQWLFAAAPGDTLPPGNNLLISGTFMAGDSAKVTLDNVLADITDIDTTVDSLVGIWYGTVDSTAFQDLAHTRLFTATTVLAQQVNNQFTATIKPIRFTSDSVKIFCAVGILGKNGKWSSPVKNSFMVRRPANTLALDATYIGGDSVRLVWNKVATADSVKLWRGTMAVSKVASPDTTVYTSFYPTAKGDTILTLHGLSLSVRYYFGAQLLRNGLWSAITAAASDSAFVPGPMDTIHPVNNLRVSAQFLAGDSAALYIDSATSIDTSLSSTMGIWYGTTSAVNVDDSLHTRWIPVSMVMQRQVAGRYRTTLQPITFSSDSVRVYYAVVIQGKNGLRSPIQSSSFTIARPANPLSLRATALSPATIKLAWNAADSVDSIRVWCGTVPVSQVVAPSTSLYTVTPAATKHDTTVVVSGLSESTLYYFGAQIMHKGLWSFISAGATDSAVTSALSVADSMSNTLKITKFVLDTNFNRLIVGWTGAVVDTGVELGISCTTSNATASRQYPPTQIVAPLTVSDTAVVKIFGTLKSDSTYYVSLWIHKKNSIWALPTDSSKASLKIPAVLGWEKVTYCRKAMDTVWAFGGRVRLSNGNDFIQTVDTLISSPILPDSIHGFIPVSTSFYFKNKSYLVPFTVGIRCDSIPAKHTLGDVRIYRYNSTTGIWRVEHGTIAEASGNIVSVPVDNLNYIFIAMIDTVAPQVTVTSDTASVWTVGYVHADTVVINDNVINPFWKFRSAKGGDVYTLSATDTGTAAQHSQTVYVSIKAADVTQENGCRAQFILSDGPNATIVPLSRRVVRDNTVDIVTTEQKKWVPLRVTAQLDSSAVSRVLGAFANNGVWTYDKNVFRLFRWHSYAGNTKQTSKWVEYNASLDSLFRFEPGRLVWLKTRDRMSLRLGSGITTSLKNSCTYTVPAQSWVDFALPYNFTVRVGDIVLATNAADANGHAGDSLQYYSWKNSSGQYYAGALYISALSAIGTAAVNPTGSVTDTLTSAVGSGYTVYNPLTVPVVLCIPPTPSGLSAVVNSSTKKKNSATNWFVTVAAKTANGDTLAPICCGYSEGSQGTTFFEAPPAFSRASVFVCDSTKKFFSHELVRGTCGGSIYTLAFSNPSDSAVDVSYSIANCANLPLGYTAMIVNPATGATENVANVSGIRLSKGETVYRQLVVGSAAYMTGVSAGLQVHTLALVGTYPNPAVHTMKIQYSLPSGMQTVNFSIIDIRGRTVWQKSVTGNSGSGLREIVWNGRSNSGSSAVGAGMYIVRMTAVNAQNKTAGTFEKKITFMP